jgi:hypothetical protein
MIRIIYSECQDVGREGVKALRLDRGYTLFALLSNLERVLAFTLIIGWYTALNQKISDTKLDSLMTLCSN